MICTPFGMLRPPSGSWGVYRLALVRIRSEFSRTNESTVNINDSDEAIGRERGKSESEVLLPTCQQNGFISQDNNMRGINLDLSITTAREMAGLETDQPQNGTGSSNSRSNSQVQADLSCSTRYKYDLAMLSGSRRILGLASHSGSLRRARCKSVRMAGGGIMMLIV